MHIKIQVQKCLIAILYPQYSHRDQMFFLNDDDDDDGDDCKGSSCWESCFCKAEKFTITNPTLSASTYWVHSTPQAKFMLSSSSFLVFFFFFSSLNLKLLYFLFEVLICSHQNCYRVVGFDMSLRWATWSSGEYINGWEWVIQNSQALQHAIHHPPPPHPQDQA